jgi:general secretion pathway protein D
MTISNLKISNSFRDGKKEGTNFLVMGFLLLLLSGCAQWDRYETDLLLASGDYEKAVAEMKAGAMRYPENSDLRAVQLRLNDDIGSKIQRQTIQLVASGKYDEALGLLKRADNLGIRTVDTLAMRENIERNQQATIALQAAIKLEQEDETEKALQVIRKALQLTPQNKTLVTLERRLHAQWRQKTGLTGLPQLEDTQLITLELRNAPFLSALESVTRSNGVNFILDKDVRQDAPVNVFLRQVRIQDALDLILSSQGLTRRIVDNKTVLVYANTPEKRKEHQDVMVKVFHLAHSEAKTMANMLRTTLKISEPFIDERANLITLRESAEVVALAERLVSLHDQPDAEVMLEVEVLEISSTRLLNLGINYPGSLSLTPLNASKAATGLTLNDLRSLNGDRIGASVSPVSFNLRRELGDGQVLANPSIRTKNREKAKILIGDKVPVVTTNSTATGIVGQNITYLEVGLKLEVEPLISPDEEVTLKVALEVSNITQQIETGSGGTAYQIGTRTASTTLRLLDGETQVLGGLISKSDKSSAGRVPGLGDLPVLGRLFGTQQDNNSQSELILAITPRIIRSSTRPDPAQSLLNMGTEQMPRLKALPTSGKEVSKSNLPNFTSNANNTDKKLTVPAGPAIWSWQANKEIAQGQEWTVNLMLSSPGDIQNVPLEIQYMPQAMEVIEVAEGEWLNSDGTPTSFSHAVNHKDGRISVAISRNSSTGVNGQGRLLKLRMRAKNSGNHEITLSHFGPLGIEGPVANSGVNKLAVKVTPVSP